MADVKIQENLAVSSGGGRDLKVDVFGPEGASAPVPGVLFLPGGGWATANRAPLRERYGLPLARRGFVCVAGEYRVMEEAPWPAQIQDVKAILRWMRANSASLGIDPGQIVVAGKSAGGHLALLAAGTAGEAEFEGNGANAGVSSAVAAAVGVAPVSDLREWGKRPNFERLFGANPAAAVLEAASPVARVHASHPPTLLVHGTSDSRVPHRMTMGMYQTLEDAGVPADLTLIAGQDHGFDQDPRFCQVVVDGIALLVSRYVATPEPVTAG